MAQEFPFIDFFTIEGAAHERFISGARENHSLDEQLNLSVAAFLSKACVM
jgi:hypothetical protein